MRKVCFIRRVLTMELTDRKPLLFTNKALALMVIPEMLSGLLAIVAGLVDSIMVSSAGEAAVSAVSLVDTINLLFITAIAGMANGGSVVTSQCIGGKDYKRACTSVNQLFYLATAVAIGLMAVLLCFRNQVLGLVYGQLEADVFQNASTYFLFTLVGYPFFAMGASSTSVLRSQRKNRQAVTVVIAMNIFNVIGNAVLIYGFHMGVAGAAIATSLSRVLYAGWGMWFAHRKELPAHFENLLKFRLDKDMLRRVFRIGITTSTENSLFHLGKVLISGLLASFGTVAIAAYSASYTINNIGWTIIIAFGTVMLTTVGQCIGAGEIEQAKLNMKKLVGAATVVLLVAFSGIYFFRGTLARMYDFEPETLKMTAYYTGIGALASLLSLYSFSFTPASGFRAAGDIRFTMIFSGACMFVCRVGMSFVAYWIKPDLGPLCIYIGMWADWAVRTVVNIVRFYSGKWIHKRLV